VSYGVTETEFSKSDLSAAEFAHLTQFCGFIRPMAAASASAVAAALAASARRSSSFQLFDYIAGNRGNPTVTCSCAVAVI
jgi:hypothetical protein